jgi:hypothetical protein
VNRKADEFQSISVQVVNQPNLDLAILRAVFAALGLQSDLMIQAFALQNNYGDFLNYCLNLVHAGKEGAVWYAAIVREAKSKGSVTAVIQVPVNLISLIRTFLATGVGGNIVNRVIDSNLQVASGAVETAAGIAKNIVESGTDIAKGGGRAASGVFDTMTASVGSDRFNQGLGDFTGGISRFGRGVGKYFLQTPADAVVMFGGRIVSGLQVLSLVEQPGRPLTGAEIGVLTPIFGNSVVYGAIRIKEGFSLLLTFGPDGDGKGGTTYYYNQRALTHGNTIYMKYKIPTSQDWYSTLVHETVHVWQNQNGGTDYMGEALWAQATVGYGYVDDILKNNKTWYLLNPEQQGQLIQDAFDAGFFTTNKGQWIEVDPNTKIVIGPRPDLASYMKGVIPQLLVGQGAT